MFVLKGILSEDLYQHFSLLSVSCLILSCKHLASKYSKHARIYLNKFVELSVKLYGEESQVLNMHSLNHLTDDVTNLGCTLSETTGFPFENLLGTIKKAYILAINH